MAQQYDNPFVNMSLISPIIQRDDYDRYCQAGRRTSADLSPFPRKVDFWFAGLSLAARKNLKPIDLTKQETVDIISGSIFNTDGWQVQAIMLIAITVDGNLEIVLDPRRMMDIANGLAAAGVPHIVEMLRDGGQKPIRNLSEALDDLLHSDIYTEEHPNRMRLSEALR